MELNIPMNHWCNLLLGREIVNLAKQEKKQSKEKTTQKEAKKIPVREYEDKKHLEKWKIGKKNFSWG